MPQNKSIYLLDPKLTMI